MTGLEYLDSLVCVYLGLRAGIRASGWGDDVGFRMGQHWCDLHMGAWDSELPRVRGLVQDVGTAGDLPGVCVRY